MSTTFFVPCLRKKKKKKRGRGEGRKKEKNEGREGRREVRGTTGERETERDREERGVGNPDSSSSLVTSLLQKS